MKETVSNSRRWLLSLILLFIGINAIQAQNDETCEAKAPQEVAVGQRFKYTVTTSEQGEIISSDFGKFEVISGPSVGSSMSISIMNGQTEQSTTYTYTYYLSCNKEGSYTIPGVTISIDGRLVKSNLVAVSVVKAPKSQPQEEPEQSGSWFNFEFPDFQGFSDFPQWPGMPQQTRPQERSKTEKAQIDDKIGKDDMFIKAFANNMEAFQGEGIVVTHKLYIKGNNNGYSIEKAIFAPSEAFWANALELDHREQSTETINGKTYTVYTIKQTAFYPTKTGKLSIPKLDLTLRIRVPATVRDPFWGTYQTYKSKDITLSSNELPVKVKALPNARSSETEIVGNFTISSSLSKTTARVNEPITLTVTVSGTGNIHHISADDLNIDFPSDCDVTYPRVSGHISAKGDIISGSKIFKYTIIPRSEGTFLIPSATYNYYNYDTGSYKTISSQDYQIEVTPGKQQSVPSDTDEPAKKRTPAKTYKI